VVAEFKEDAGVVHFDGAKGSVIDTSSGDGSLKDGEDLRGSVASSMEVPKG
jgi:hypothetical protein